MITHVNYDDSSGAAIYIDGALYAIKFSYSETEWIHLLRKLGHKVEARTVYAEELTEFPSKLQDLLACSYVAE